MTSLDGLWWLLASLLPLIWLQRSLHREIMAVFLLLTRGQEVSMVLFSLLFFPGVLLHELSHWLTARLLGVRTGQVWLLPERMPDGKLRMGYVETERADVLREALIGFAPLLFGGVFVGFAGLYRMRLDTLWEVLQTAQWGAMPAALQTLSTQTDFWLWFYLIFVVSSTMLPSLSDRQAWTPVLIFAGVLLGMALLAGAGPWLLANLAPWLDGLLRAAAVVFGISVVVHLALLLPVVLLRKLLNRVTGLQVAG